MKKIITEQPKSERSILLSTKSKNAFDEENRQNGCGAMTLYQVKALEKDGKSRTTQPN
jgi:hypothetical protein